MSAADNGGPAFPTKEFIDGVGETYAYGMTLRDYFAAHAPITMQDAIQIFRNDEIPEFTFAELVEKLAGMRVIYADAMLEARK